MRKSLGKVSSRAESVIRRLKKYTDVQEFSREIALEHIEYITVDEYAADRPRDIHIYYKLLKKPLPHKKYLVVDKDGELDVCGILGALKIPRSISYLFKESGKAHNSIICGVSLNYFTYNNPKTY